MGPLGDPAKEAGVYPRSQPQGSKNLHFEAFFLAGSQVLHLLRGWDGLEGAQPLVMGCGEHPKNLYPVSAPYTKPHQPSSPLPALPHPPSSHLPWLRSSSTSSLRAGHPHSVGSPVGCSTACLATALTAAGSRLSSSSLTGPDSMCWSGRQLSVRVGAGVLLRHSHLMGLNTPVRVKTSLGWGGHRAWALTGQAEQSASPHYGNFQGEAPPEGLGAPPWGPACVASPLACHGEGLPSILPLGIPP